MHFQHHVLHGKAEIPYLRGSLQKLVKCDAILSAKTGFFKQCRFSGKILDKYSHHCYSALFSQNQKKSQCVLIIQFDFFLLILVIVIQLS